MIMNFLPYIAPYCCQIKKKVHRYTDTYTACITGISVGTVLRGGSWIRSGVYIYGPRWPKAISGNLRLSQVVKRVCRGAAVPRWPWLDADAKVIFRCRECGIVGPAEGWAALMPCKLERKCLAILFEENLSEFYWQGRRAAPSVEWRLEKKNNYMQTVARVYDSLTDTLVWQRESAHLLGDSCACESSVMLRYML